MNERAKNNSLDGLHILVLASPLSFTVVLDYFLYLLYLNMPVYHINSICVDNGSYVDILEFAKGIHG